MGSPSRCTFISKFLRVYYSLASWISISKNVNCAIWTLLRYFLFDTDFSSVSIRDVLFDSTLWYCFNEFFNSFRKYLYRLIIASLSSPLNIILQWNSIQLLFHCSFNCLLGVPIQIFRARIAVVKGKHGLISIFRFFSKQNERSKNRTLVPPTACSRTEHMHNIQMILILIVCVYFTALVLLLFFFLYFFLFCSVFTFLLLLSTDVAAPFDTAARS